MSNVARIRDEDIRPTTDSVDDPHLLRGLIHEFFDALRAKDTARVVGFYSPDNSMFTLAPPLRSIPGKTGGEPAIEEWFAQFEGPIDTEVRELKLHVDGDVAFCSSINHQTGRRKSGEAMDLWYRSTIGFSRVRGEWKIVHQHESVPFHMDGSLKAAIDLKP